jgi:hypothetical protein
MVIITGAELGFDDLTFLPVKFNFLATDGEAFWVPGVCLLAYRLG